MSSEQQNYHLKAMAFALMKAEESALAGELPIAAVLLFDNRIISWAQNTQKTDKDPLAHAEIKVLREASSLLKCDKLFSAELYCTLEPCLMCAGAIINAGISKLFYAAKEPKTGAAGSVLNVFESKLNHHCELTWLQDFEEKSANLLRVFFRAKRQGKQAPDKSDFSSIKLTEALSDIKGECCEIIDNTNLNLDALCPQTRAHKNFSRRNKERELTQFLNLQQFPDINELEIEP